AGLPFLVREGEEGHPVTFDIVEHAVRKHFHVSASHHRLIFPAGERCASCGQSRMPRTVAAARLGEQSNRLVQHSTSSSGTAKSNCTIIDCVSASSIRVPAPDSEPASRTKVAFPSGVPQVPSGPW